MMQLRTLGIHFSGGNNTGDEFDRLNDIEDISTVETNSFAAHMSYTIEILLNRDWELYAIQYQIYRLQEQGLWPTHINLVYAQTDVFTGIGSSAFLNTNTNEVYLAFAGTNLDVNGTPLQDVATYGEILFGGIGENSAHMNKLRDFVNRVNELIGSNFTITNATGHSLGGKYAQMVNDFLSDRLERQVFCCEQKI